MQIKIFKYCIDTFLKGDRTITS